MIPNFFSPIQEAIAPALGHHSRRPMLFAIVAGPLLFGLFSGPQIRGQLPPTSAAPLPSFEVATIKPDHTVSPGVSVMLPPGRFTATNVTAKMLIEYAYGGNQAGITLRDDQLSGAPGWLNSERYDIEAKVEDSLVKEQEQKLPFEKWAGQVRLMVQSLLADRFKLKVSHTTKELPVYALVIAKGGSKLKLSTVPPLGAPGADPPGAGLRRGPMMRMGRGQITGVARSAGALADALSRQPELAGRAVIDETALEGKYDFTLNWTPEQSQSALPMGPVVSNLGTASAPPPESSGPSIFTAIQEQLGLKLESTRGPVEVIVIDHIERPSEN